MLPRELVASMKYEIGEENEAISTITVHYYILNHSLRSDLSKEDAIASKNIARPTAVGNSNTQGKKDSDPAMNLEHKELELLTKQSQGNAGNMRFTSRGWSVLREPYKVESSKTELELTDGIMFVTWDVSSL